MRMFADENGEFYPESGGDVYWNAIDAGTGRNSWMQQIVSYAGNTNVFNCPEARTSCSRTAMPSGIKATTPPK